MGCPVVTLAVLILGAAQDTTSGIETTQAVRAALGRGLAFPERGGVARMETKGCASCQHVPMKLGTHHEGRKHGLSINVEAAEDWALGQHLVHPELMPTGQALCALVAAGEPHAATAIRRAWKFLLGSQKDDGSWAMKTRTPRGHDEIVSSYGTGWATLGLLCSLLQDEPGRADRERTIADLAKRGVEFELDRSRPGSPVVAVNFLLAEGPVTDADLSIVEGMGDLRRLDLACRRPAYTDAGLAHVERLVRLEMIRLSDSKITDAGLVHLKRLGNLRTVWLDRTRITDAGLAELGTLTRLHDLFLDQTPVGDAGLVHLRPMTELAQLGLKNTGVTDAGLATLHDLPLHGSLQSLYLAGLPISDAGLARLKGFDRLAILDLSDTRTSDAGLARLHDLPALETLYLFDTRITDAGLAHLAGMPHLKDLFLAGLPITDAGLAHLTGLKSLEWLDLDGTKVTDAGLGRLRGLTNLRKIDLRRTGVSEEGVRQLREALPKANIDYQPAE